MSYFLLFNKELNSLLSCLFSSLLFYNSFKSKEIIIDQYNSANLCFIK